MGKIELDHTGAGSGVTLSSDGTDLLLNGTAIGAALELYAENPSSPTAPSATGDNAVAIGSESVSAGTRSVALGDSYASGTDSFAAAIANNTSSYGAQGTQSVSLQPLSKATSTSDFAAGFSASATGGSSTAIGAYATADSSYGIALGASSNTRGISYAIKLGRSTGIYNFQQTTSNATPRLMTTTGSSVGSASNQISIYADYRAIAFEGMIVVRWDTPTFASYGAYKIEGLIRRHNGVAQTVLENSSVTVITNIFGSIPFTLSADTTNGALAITVTGSSSRTYRWAASIRTTELTI